jgi:hypothetical protein
MLDFNKLKTAVDKQFKMMSKHKLFRTGTPGDFMWDVYLQSFPADANPIYRERTAHDCSCCKHFIRNMGNVVAIIDDKMVSLWDFTCDEPVYNRVAKVMGKVAKDSPISDVFLHYEYSIGTDHNFEDDDGRAVRWDHFHVDLPKRNDTPNFHCAKDGIPTALGEYRSTHDVLARSLTELSRDAIDTVIELIGAGSLYRGNEYKDAVYDFSRLKLQFDLIKDPREQDLFVWAKVVELRFGVSRIRNTAIGTLLIDLTDGLELEDAVRKFEAVMAPANYKRPTALVTPRMVEAARKEVAALGLTSALERRYATLADISVNNVIFANRKARKVMKDAFDDIATKAVKPKDLAKVETITVEKFIDDVVPNIDSIEVYVENKHANNLMSLIAPVDRGAAPLFKWDNNFSWSYTGDVADSIRERVKKAGGNVTGDLCCRLAWSNFDDLDFHMFEPDSHGGDHYGGHIYFRNKRSHITGGMLDVDMNAGGGHTREPVENIFYGSRRAMTEGVYVLGVHQFAQRERDNVGFEVEIDYLGDVMRFAYDKAVRQSEQIEVATFNYSHKDGFKLLKSLPQSSASKTIWGIKTGDFQKVNVLLRSPNHWDGERGIGNLHYFFMLDGCANDGQARGFYNEFLKPALDKHRKVIELVGSKLKVEADANQLSGLGFSDTRHTEILVRVTGNITRVLKVLI